MPPPTRVVLVRRVVGDTTGGTTTAGVVVVGDATGGTTTAGVVVVVGATIGGTVVVTTTGGTATVVVVTTTGGTTAVVVVGTTMAGVEAERPDPTTRTPGIRAALLGWQVKSKAEIELNSAEAAVQRKPSQQAFWPKRTSLTVPKTPQTWLSTAQVPAAGGPGMTPDGSEGVVTLVVVATGGTIGVVETTGGTIAVVSTGGTIAVVEPTGGITSVVSTGGTIAEVVPTGGTIAEVEAPGRPGNPEPTTRTPGNRVAVLG
jgi:hypothetical protein